jgi:hypothetical protein
VIICVFSVFNRTPISRDRDCYGLAENSEISGGRQVFGLHQRFDHFDHLIGTDILELLGLVCLL